MNIQEDITKAMTADTKMKTMALYVLPGNFVNFE